MGNQSSTQKSYLANPVILQVGNSPIYGNYLTDSTGRAVYIHTRDRKDQSSYHTPSTVWSAYDWPSVSLVPNPTYGNGVHGSKVGAVKGETPQRQITYNHWPLYFYEHDELTGTTKGAGVDGTWYLISPEGNPIVRLRTEEASSDAPIQSYIWKQQVTLPEFTNYYNYRNWRRYANNHGLVWRNPHLYNNWRRRNWGYINPRINDAYSTWLVSNNPQDLNDWHVFRSLNW